MTEDEKVFLNRVNLLNSKARSLAYSIEFKDIPNTCDLIFKICSCIAQPEKPETDYLLETQRNIYEIVPTILICQPDADLEIVERARQETYKRGFQNMPVECSATFAFISYYLRNNLISHARVLADGLLLKLEKHPSSTPESLKKNKLQIEILLRFN